MQAIEEQLIVVFDSSPDVDHEGQVLEPFAIVKGVLSDSPAASAGLLQGDKVLRFHGRTKKNLGEFAAIADIVKQRENVNLALDLCGPFFLFTIFWARWIFWCMFNETKLMLL